MSLSLIKFFQQFPTEENATQYFEKIRWNNAIVCPFCGSIHIANCKYPMPYRCKDCRKHFSVRTKTVLAESRLPLQKWLLAIYILTNSKKGVSSIQLADYLGVTQKTAWFLSHRIRETWKQSDDKLCGIVEIDETYFGGKEKNKHNSKKLKQGRGAVGKQPVMGLKTRLGDIRSFVIDNNSKEVLTEKIRKYVEVGSTIYTDEFRAYTNLDEYNHQKVNHSVGEYVKESVFTNGIESFWSLLKRAYYGIYHHWSKKHMQRYIDEFATRVFIQHDTNSLCYTIVNGIGVHLSYKELIHG